MISILQNHPPKKQKLVTRSWFSKFGKLYILKFHDFNYANPPP